MSRRLKLILTICSIVSLSLLVWLDRNYIRQALKPNPKTAEQIQHNDFIKYNNKTFSVVKIIDGDTIDIDIPDSKYDHTRIRLWGIDTPETKNHKTGSTYFGSQATEFAQKLALGNQVTIYLEQHRTRGKYGRLLAYVQLSDGCCLNEILIKEGFAYADTRFRHSFYNKYQQLQTSALRQKKGLWKNVKRNQLPLWLKDKIPRLPSEN